jgi:RHS repeat-associated protein
MVWSWEAKPFGDSAPNEDPDGDSTKVTLNLRFPGQYYDEETGLYYNYYRYYDPETGRYITSDPIGLDGGLNTYAYANGAPVNWIDPKGLREGWGGGIHAFIIGITHEHIYDSCCKNGKVIKRTIAMNCLIFGPGLELGFKGGKGAIKAVTGLKPKPKPKWSSNIPNEGHCGQTSWSVSSGEGQYGGN